MEFLAISDTLLSVETCVIGFGDLGRERRVLDSTFGSLPPNSATVAAPGQCVRACIYTA